MKVDLSLDELKILMDYYRSRIRQNKGTRTLLRWHERIEYLLCAYRAEADKAPPERINTKAW